ncbi:MAG: signal peptidase I [Desulfobacterales bacterium]|nr:signal peptidase I [Desulfobacterales bacterium]
MLTETTACLSGWWKDLQCRIRSLTPRKGLCLLAGFLTLSFAGAVIPGRFSVSPSNSVGYRLFYLKPQFKRSSLKKGTFVLFDVYTKLMPDCWPCLAVKKIVCTEGDVLSVNQRNFYCNKEYIGTAKPCAKDGAELEAFQFNGVVPGGKLFVAGACVDSYDSRYIGFIDKKDIKAIVVPII